MIMRPRTPRIARENRMTPQEHIAKVEEQIGREWSKRCHKHSFPKSFPAGKEADGRLLYISQTNHTTIAVGVTIDPITGIPGISYDRHSAGWHLGKAGVHLAIGMTYSWGGDEYNGEYHWVFSPQDPEDYEWMEGVNGSFPPNSVKGWNGNENQRIARGIWNGGVHPGKLIPSSGACYIGWGGKEIGLSRYEVLVRKRRERITG